MLFEIRFFLVLMLLCPSIVMAQNPLGFPLVNNYNKVVFQGGSRTWDIKQDSRGIMYFANNEGLITFDGKYWKRYTLPNQTILRSIFIDDNDRVYVGGQGEFGYFEAAQGEGLQYTSLQEKVPQAYHNFADIWNTVVQGHSVFFRASNAVFEFKNGKIKVHKARVEWDFMGMADGRLFAQDRADGLLEFTDATWRSVGEVNPFQGIKLSDMFAIAKDKIMLTTLNNKSYILQGDKIYRTEASAWQNFYTPSAAKIDEQAYVVATATEGCIVRDMNGRFKQRIGVVEGLQNKNVSAVYVDQQKNIWAAVDNAIAVISYGSAVRYFRPNMENDVTGYSTQVYQGRLYMSSTNGVYQAPLMAGIEDHSLSPGTFSLIKGSDGGEAWRLDTWEGSLLLGHNRGLYKMDHDQVRPIALKTGSWTVLPTLTTGGQQEALVGTYTGIDLISLTPHGFVWKSTLRGVSDSYRFLERDTAGNIWASHPYRGIYKIKVSSRLDSYVATLYTEKEGLPSDFQNYVFRVNGMVLFATGQGIYKFDEARNRFVPDPKYAVFTGMPIKYLTADEDGNIWFCSGKKIGIAQRDTGKGNYKITYFPEIEGLYTSGFENIYPYDRNNVYIGSEKGIIHINYEKYAQEKFTPKVLLSSVVAIGDRDSVIFNGYFQNGGEKGQYQHADNIPKLAASYNAYIFEYAAPSYGIHENVTYSYRLDGYDKEWSAWISSTEKQYTNLPNGTYTFRVKVRNNLNEESEIVSYSFVILPPWYKTVWAFCLYALGILVGLYGLVVWQKRVWLQQQQKFDAQLAQLQYIHQLEIEKNEKEIVKLQNEKLEHEVLSKTKELASTSMQLMENSGALSKLRVELAKLDKGEEGEDLRKITTLLKDVEKNTAHWDQFASHFDELNDGFLHRLKTKHPKLSRNDLKVCAYLRLNFSSKQIAQLQSISVRGVEIHRYRLRKKMDMETELSLNDYLSQI